MVVVCTRNMMEGTDKALMDRLEMRMRLGLPGIEVRVRILMEVVERLSDKGVVDDEQAGAGGVVGVSRVCKGVS